MDAPSRGCFAGLISWKLRGGMLSTLLIFFVVYALLKNC